MPFGVRGILYLKTFTACTLAACTEILRNKKVNIPFALQPSFLGFLDTKNFFFIKAWFQSLNLLQGKWFLSKVNCYPLIISVHTLFYIVQA